MASSDVWHSFTLRLLAAAACAFRRRSLQMLAASSSGSAFIQTKTLDHLKDNSEQHLPRVQFQLIITSCKKRSRLCGWLQAAEHELSVCLTTERFTCADTNFGLCPENFTSSSLVQANNNLWRIDQKRSVSLVGLPPSCARPSVPPQPVICYSPFGNRQQTV